MSTALEHASPLPLRGEGQGEGKSAAGERRHSESPATARDDSARGGSIVRSVPSPPPSPGVGRGGTLVLTLTGCGTAIACVCALGLTQLQRSAGGLWSVAAIVIAGGICALLARVFARLSSVIPSGAGLLAWFSRGIGRRAGVLLAGPYLLLTLFLVGAEATIAGTLLNRLLPGVPAAAGALVFLAGTWAFCRAGLRIGFRAQTFATVALVLLLGGLSIAAVVHAGSALPALLLPPAPRPAAFLACVGQALFLFMGFELLTAHVEQSTPATMKKSLVGTTAALTVFYALLAVGLACVPSGGLLAQLALAKGPVLWLVVLVCLLASFTSFNGALLALSRLVGALASQGALPRSLAKVEARGLVPARALSVLLVLSMIATALVLWGRALEPAMLAAAVAASVLYAAAAWVRERAPFAEASRTATQRFGGSALGAAFAAIGAGVLVTAGLPAVAMLAGACAVTGVLALRIKKAATLNRPGGSS